MPGLAFSFPVSCDDGEDGLVFCRFLSVGSATPLRPKNWRGLKGWSWLGELMIVSQITACEGGIVPDDEEGGELEGHEAVM